MIGTLENLAELLHVQGIILIESVAEDMIGKQGFIGIVSERTELA